MQPAIIGKKVGMTRVYDGNGAMVPATVVLAGPCSILQVKTRQRDGYEAVQLGFDDVRPKRSSRAMIGHAAKASAAPKRVVREVRLVGPTDRQAGQTVTVAEFAEGKVDYVDVTGMSKGKGFQGVMKRWGFGGQPGSHGTERKHRSGGSIASYGSERGGSGGPKRGKRMAGHMGHARATMRNQKVLRVVPEHNLLMLAGSLPGPNGGYLLIRQARIAPVAHGKKA